MRGRSVPYVLGHPELFGEKHEETGQGVVQLTMSSPVCPIHDIVTSVVRPSILNMPENALKDLASDYGPCESCVLCSSECVSQKRGFFFPVSEECIFRGW
jgi:hypothetical protein